MKNLDIVRTGGATLVVSLMALHHGSTEAAAQAAYDPMQPPQAALLPGGESSDSGLEPEEEAVASLNPDFENMPDTTGVEETYYTCSACHSVAIVKQQRISDERWNYLWNWMVEEQGMHEPDARTKEIILSYLTTHFSSER